MAVVEAASVSPPEITFDAPPRYTGGSLVRGGVGFSAPGAMVPYIGSVTPSPSPSITSDGQGKKRKRVAPVAVSSSDDFREATKRVELMTDEEFAKEEAELKLRTTAFAVARPARASKKCMDF
jgi:hypothetical protein